MVANKYKKLQNRQLLQGLLDLGAHCLKNQGRSETDVHFQKVKNNFHISAVKVTKSAMIRFYFSSLEAKNKKHQFAPQENETIQWINFPKTQGLSYFLVFLKIKLTAISIASLRGILVKRLQILFKTINMSLVLTH